MPSTPNGVRMVDDYQRARKGRPRERLHAMLKREGTWVCWLCGHPILRNGTVTCGDMQCWGTRCSHTKGRVHSRHPKAWSNDHYIPLSKRPDLWDDPANCREAHYWCNSARQDNQDYISPIKGSASRTY